MGYRNQTYVIFDGDKDMWAYAYMLGWISKDHIDFKFFNAHELKTINSTSSEETVKGTLRLRLSNTKQAIVLVGESTKNLYRYVRWEMEYCLSEGIPIVAVNLNNKREIDLERCPPLLKETATIHVSFNAKIIQKALDNFCGDFSSYKDGVNWHYEESAYKALGL